MKSVPWGNRLKINKNETSMIIFITQGNDYGRVPYNTHIVIPSGL